MSRMRHFFQRFFATIFVVLFIYCFLSLRGYTVSGDSMTPTLDPADIVFVDKISPYFSPFSRGEMIVFHDNGSIKIKRVIGFPGEKITIKDGGVFVSDERIVESYLPASVRTCVPGACLDLGINEYEVPENSYFVLWDNRLNSRDSRGCQSVDNCDEKIPSYIPQKEVIGRVIFSW